MPSLSISTIQANLTWENKAANLEMFAEKIAAIEEPTELVILPEMFSTGFSMNPAVEFLLPRQLQFGGGEKQST